MTFIFNPPLDDANPSLAAGGEAGFGEIVEASRKAQVYADNTNSSGAALYDAYQNRIKAIQTATGVALQNPGDVPANLTNPRVAAFMSEAGYFDRGAVAEFDKQRADLLKKYPDAADAIAINQSMEADAKDLAGQTHADYERIYGSRPGFMSGVASFMGGMEGGFRDPLNIAGLFVGGPEVGAAKTVFGGIIKTAAKDALVNGAFAAAAQPMVQAWHKEIGLPAGWGDAVKNVLTAAGLGATLGGSLHAGGELLASGAPMLHGAALDMTAELMARTLKDGDPLKAALRGDVDAAAQILSTMPQKNATVRGALLAHVVARESDSLRPADISPETHADAMAAATNFAENPDTASPAAVRDVLAASRPIAVPGKPITLRPLQDDTAILPSGEKVPVKYAVVEARDLVTSHLENGAENPNYPQDLQPRDRSRGISMVQVHNIANRLEPALLDTSAKASDGAPIISADGVVESGNGRGMAISKAYAEGLPGAARYKQYLADRGYPAQDMKEPVLVRVRQGDMTAGQRQAFTRAANERDTLGMSSTERARADAQALPDGTLDLWRGGEIGAPANRAFVRSFLDHAVAANDRAAMVGADGALSQEAVRRIQAAMLARAYGDEKLLSILTEDLDNNIRAIGGALVEAAPNWSRMRANARAGTIARGADTTANLVEAVHMVRQARREKKGLGELLGQADIFSGKTVAPETEGFLRLMFRNDAEWTQPTGRERLAEILGFYVDEANKTTDTVDLLGEGPTPPAAILKTAKEKLRKSYDANEQAGIFDDRAAAPGENDGARGADGGNGAGAQAQEAPGAGAARQGGRRTYVDTRGAGERFHGSPVAIRPDDFHASSMNYYGQGFYTTDAMDIAHGYATRRGSETPHYYRVKERGAVKAFDMEQPVPDWLVARESEGGLVGLAMAEKPKNVRQLYDLIRENSRAEGVSAGEVQEIFDSLRARLEEKGFNALDHAGGLRTKKAPHSVRIYFEPTRQLEVDKIAPGDYQNAPQLQPPPAAGAPAPSNLLPDMLAPEPSTPPPPPETPALPTTVDEATAKQADAFLRDAVEKDSDGTVHLMTTDAAGNEFSQAFKIKDALDDADRPGQLALAVQSCKVLQ